MEVREHITGKHDAIIEFPDKNSKHDCTVLNLATVTPEPIKWLWPGRIPLGMYSLMAGPPGVGKSTLAFNIAAIVTTGGKWPFSDYQAAPGGVIILTAEDDPKYTLVPRLMAADADLKRINLIQSVTRTRDDQVIDSPLRLSEDMRQLHGVLTELCNTRLIIIDPISAYLGVKDSHRDADVRQVLGPLTDLAARHDVAILGITHLSKNTANSAISRFMGSTGIVAASRAAFLVTQHDDQLMLLPVKSNVAPASNGGLIYSIVGKTIPGNIETSCIEWIGQTDMDADEALAQQSVKQSSPKLTEAKEFLEAQLQDGPKRQPEIEAAAEQCGITWSTVRRARHELKVKSHKDRFSGGWKWHTPEQFAERQQHKGAYP